MRLTADLLLRPSGKTSTTHDSASFLNTDNRIQGYPCDYQKGGVEAVESPLYVR